MRGGVSIRRVNASRGLRNRGGLEFRSKVISHLAVASDRLRAKAGSAVFEELFEGLPKCAGSIDFLFPLYLKPLGGLGVDRFAARGETALLIPLPRTARADGKLVAPGEGVTGKQFLFDRHGALIVRLPPSLRSATGDRG
jgi:hypothetical protein